MSLRLELQSPRLSEIQEFDFLSGFEEITLDDMDGVNLLNRFDSKYCIDKVNLLQVLEEIENEYFVLEVAGIRAHSYSSIYYDTPDNRFYLDHHNGIANRLKVRKRKYLDSGLVFLEIKKKNNKGKTMKKRTRIKEFNTVLCNEELDFIRSFGNRLEYGRLIPRFSNRFTRITLVNKNLKERCTIDLDLEFHAFWNLKCKIDDLVIIELKQESRCAHSKLADVLKAKRFYSNGFSKYCLGRALNEDSIKQNLFKPQIRQIRKHYNVQQIV